MGLGGGGGGPEEAGEFAGDSDDDHVVWFAAGAYAVEHVVQAVLGAVGDREDVLGLAVLAAVERRADPWWTGVVRGRFDQQPAGELGADLGDRALSGGLAGLVPGRGQPEPRSDTVRLGEPVPSLRA